MKRWMAHTLRRAAHWIDPDGKDIAKPKALSAANAGNHTQAIQSVKDMGVRCERLFEVVYELTPVMINAWGPDGNLMLWNPACEQTLGYTISEVMGLSDVHAVLYCGKDAQRSREHVKEANGKLEKFCVRIKDGSCRQQLWANHKTKSGVIVGFGLDIDRQEKAYEQLHESIQTLKEANSELEQFAYIASHDLQEPLRKILVNADRMKRSWDSFQVAANAGDEDTAGRMLKRIDSALDIVSSAAERNSALVHDMLMLSRAMSHDIIPVVVSLDVILQRCVDAVGEKVLALNASITLNPSPMPEVFACADDVFRIFLNVLSNALKFTIDGRKPAISITARSLTTQTVEIVVCDNGAGFPSSRNEEIFLPLKRAHTRSDYEGTGLGLSICRKLAQRNNGSIKGEGYPNEGATFIVRLPAAENSASGTDHQ